VAEVSNQATETARQILQLREQHRLAITEHLGRAAGNGHKILDQLYERPIVSVKEVLEITGTTYAAANQLVQRLTDLGILTEVTGYRRQRRFAYQPYIQVFRDDREDVS
jgi:Fic family protein